MFINFVWAGPPPTKIDPLKNPIYLKRILNIRAQEDRDKPVLWPIINFWCFRQFAAAFAHALRQADDQIPGRIIPDRITITMKFIDDLLNIEWEKYGIDRDFNKMVKYCIAVSGMIKAYVLMKELISPLILMHCPGFVSGSDIQYQENFCFPVGDLPKFVIISYAPLKDPRSIVSTARYTQISNYEELFDLFKKNFKALMRYNAQHRASPLSLPRSRTAVLLESFGSIVSLSYSMSPASPTSSIASPASPPSSIASPASPPSSIASPANPPPPLMSPASPVNPLPQTGQRMPLLTSKSSLPRSSGTNSSRAALPPRLKQGEIRVASFQSNVLYPIPDAWLSFAPDTLVSKKILFHLAKALCVYTYSYFPDFFDPTIYDEICDNYLDFNFLEGIWRTEGLSKLKNAHFLNIPIPQDQLKSLCRFYDSRSSTAMNTSIRKSLIADIVISPYIEVGSFLFPLSETGTYTSPLWIFDDLLYINLPTDVQKNTPDLQYEAKVLAREYLTFDRFIITDLKYGPTPGREIPNTEEINGNVFKHIRTIQKYGILKYFGTSDWRELPKDFLRDPAEDQELTEFVHKKLKEFGTEADDPEWQEFIRRLNEP